MHLFVCVGCACCQLSLHWRAHVCVRVRARLRVRVCAGVRLYVPMRMREHAYALPLKFVERLPC